LERTRRLYQRHRDSMLEALDRFFPRDSVWSRPAGGLFLWVALPESVSADDVFLEAKKNGVLFSRGSLFFIDGRGHNCMRLGYSMASEAEIERGVRVLGRIIQSSLHKSKRTLYYSARERLPLV